jgi:hypothetical protein
MVKRFLAAALVVGAISLASPRNAAAYNDCGRCYYSRGAHAYICIGFPVTWQCEEEVDYCIDSSGGCSIH